MGGARYMCALVAYRRWVCMFCLLKRRIKESTVPIADCMGSLGSNLSTQESSVRHLSTRQLFQGFDKPFVHRGNLVTHGAASFWFMLVRCSSNEHSWWVLGWMFCLLTGSIPASPRESCGRTLRVRPWPRAPVQPKLAALAVSLSMLVQDRFPQMYPPNGPF